MRGESVDVVSLLQLKLFHVKPRYSVRPSPPWASVCSRSLGCSGALAGGAAPGSPVHVQRATGFVFAVVIYFSDLRFFFRAKKTKIVASMFARKKNTKIAGLISSEVCSCAFRTG